MPDSNAAFSDPNVTAAIASPSYYTNSAGIYQQTQSGNYTNTSPVKAKKKKEKPAKVENTKKPKVEKAPKPEKPLKLPKVEKVPKSTKKNSKSIERAVEPPKKPTRVLSRARKIVNYSEEKSRSPTPSSRTVVANSEVITEQEKPNELVTSPIQNFEQPIEFYNSDNQNTLKFNNDEQFHNLPDESPSKNLLVGDHPPIVLRISKVSIHYFVLMFHKKIIL